MSEFDLVKPQDVILLDLVSDANKVCQGIGEYFEPMPEGLYVQNKLEPVLRKGVTYYTQTTHKPVVFGKFESLEDLSHIDEPLVDVAGARVVFNPKIFERYKRLYSVKADPLARAYYLIQGIVKDLLNEKVRHRMNFHNELFVTDKIVENLKPGSEQFFTDGTLDNLCHDVLSDVEAFLDNDFWNIYFVELKGKDLYVEKSVDFRIFDWTARMNSGEWE